MRDCDSLNTIILSENIISIGDEFLDLCRSMKNFVMPNSVKTIGKSFMSRCINLETLKLSSNIKSIGSAFLYNTNNYTKIFYGGKNKAVIDFLKNQSVLK